RDAIRASYRDVCQALVRIDTLRRRARERAAIKSTGIATDLDPLIAAVAAGERELSVDPHARLLIYGFDAAQRDATLPSIVNRIRKSLPDVPIYAVGRTAGTKVTPAFRGQKPLSTSVPEPMPLPAASPRPEPAAQIALPAGSPAGLSLYFELSAGDV